MIAPKINAKTDVLSRTSIKSICGGLYRLLGTEFLAVTIQVSNVKLPAELI